MSVDFVFSCICFIETLSLISQILLILMLYQDRITRRGSKGFSTMSCWQKLCDPTGGSERKKTFSVLLSLPQEWKKTWVRKVCRLRKEIAFCCTFRLEFKAEYVKKKLEIHPINKILSHCGGRGMEETKLKTTNQNLQKN